MDPVGGVEFSLGTEILGQGAERKFLLDAEVAMPHDGGGSGSHGVAAGSPTSLESGVSGCAADATAS